MVSVFFADTVKRFCVVIGVTRRNILPLLKGEEKPTDTAKIADYNRANEDLYAMLYLLVVLRDPQVFHKGHGALLPRSSEPYHSSLYCRTFLGLEILQELLPTVCVDVEISEEYETE